MTNLSSLFKLKIALAGLAFIAIGGSVETMILNGVGAIDIIILAFTTTFIIFSFFYFKKLSVFLKDISDVCGKIKQGDFESRIINKSEGGELGKLADSVNNAIDVCDAFVRESQLAMKAASEGKFYRKIRTEGMRGMFLHSVQGINSAIDYLKAQDEVDKKNKAMIEQTMESISSVVENASKGNLSERIDAEKFEGGYKDLVQSMNGLMETIIEPLNDIMRVLDALSQGDLTEEIKEQYEGMFNDIKTSVNGTITKLRQVAGNIRETAMSVGDSANEISSASTDLSKRTENQASTLEETAASMEQITATVKQNTENANDANNFSQEAKKVAEDGGTVVKKVVGAMGEISESSNKIAEIISVIDEIAFQTNLLALNAAVEAARAGDAGKGFAVVADEVRALAGRSAQASKEIKDLIQASVEQVKDGSELVNQSGESLDKIVESFNTLATKVSEIADASAEQASGVEEVNSAVTEMDQVTQQNAAMVEEATASAQSLSQMAQDLNQLIGFFKTNDSEAVAASGSGMLLSDDGDVSERFDDDFQDNEPVGQSQPANRKVIGNSDGWEEF